MRVTRCVCRERAFAELRALAAAEGLDLDGLGEATGCGRACGLCRPYLALMLRTGRTSFHPDEAVPGAEDPARPGGTEAHR